jgi:hypothetical protein
MTSVRVEPRDDDFAEVADGRFEKRKDGKVTFGPKSVSIFLFEYKFCQYRINILSAPVCQEELSAKSP